MSRVAFPLVLQSPSTGSAIVGATATITEHVVGDATLGTGAAASIYTQEVGGVAQPTNQITTDNLGRWTQGSGAGYAQYWLPQGTYDIVISGAGLTAYAITRELISGEVNSDTGGMFQSGDLKASALPAAPTGWLLCDGTAFSRTTYATLFAAIGSTYGVGDGETTFNVPDLRGRTPIGAGTGTAAGASDWTLGEQPAGAGVRGGEETHTLDVAEMPSHNHGVNDDGHSHNVGLYATYENTAGNAYPMGASAEISGPYETGTTGSETGVSIQDAGGGGAHNNVQPVSVVNWFIKT